MPRRKPSWLKHLCTGRLKARKCAGCREWVAVDEQGPVWEAYDPGVLDAKDLTTAIILERPFTRIHQYTAGLLTLQNPCGARGISPDGQYLAVHECHRTPISLKPFTPVRRKPVPRWDPGIHLSDEDVRLFTELWRRPL
ncbi:hypothetical protein BTIS_1650 [Bifidobacterium tissieri]|uniref:Uncharacterized protein n=1 Tax=Bifidobacterium tissieri TaxID=1630162 RepID=A0A261FD16_9BIFI|nr:hypothetical protein [Bifidobacterium tissieri]OZG56988.1 hypothetical protein BTIS_1650 [Bifidobacterium tissieri]